MPFHVRRKEMILERNLRLFSKPVISMAPGTSIRICGDCVFCSTSEGKALRVSLPVVLRTIGEERLTGANVTINNSDSQALAPVGRRYDDDCTQTGCSPLATGDNVFLGTGSAILNGTSAGDNSVIIAFSVATKPFPSRVIARDNRAQQVRAL